MPLSYLNSTVSASFMWDAQNTQTGPTYAFQQSKGPVQNSQIFSTCYDNDLLGGADEIVSFATTIGYSQTLSIDCSSISNVLGQTVSLFRIKAYRFRLISTCQDAYNGTLCSQISISSPIFTNIQGNYSVYNGGDWQYFDQTPGGFIVNSGATKISVVNNDSTWNAFVQILLIGGST